MTDYGRFLESKRLTAQAHGIEVADVHPSLFPHQADIVRWALRRGRAAVFADCGLGKSFMQLEWARQVCAHTGGRVLILTPLAVAQQTAAEARRFGIEAVVSRDGALPESGIVITNYQNMHKFSAPDFAGVVLDESSILKAFDGKFRSLIIDTFSRTPYRLA